MKIPKYTPAFILIIVGIVAAYDIWAIYILGKPESISAHIIGMSQISPAIPFLGGFICGHLFWPMNPKHWANRFFKK